MLSTNFNCHDSNNLSFSETFDRVFKSNYKRLCIYAFQFVRDESTSEDIVQNCFVKLWNKREIVDFTNPTSLLYKMVKDETCDFLRRKKTVSDEEVLKYWEDETTVRYIAYSETIAQIANLADQLPPQCRKIFRQLFFEHKMNIEVAQDLNITERAVRKQKEKALQFIRARYSPFVFLLAFYNLIFN